MSMLTPDEQRLVRRLLRACRPAVTVEDRDTIDRLLSSSEVLLPHNDGVRSSS